MRKRGRKRKVPDPHSPSCVSEQVGGECEGGPGCPNPPLGQTVPAQGQAVLWGRLEKGTVCLENLYSESTIRDVDLF